MGSIGSKTVERLDPRLHGALLRLLQKPEEVKLHDVHEEERVNLHGEAVDQIASKWAPDTDDYLQRAYPQLYKGLLDSEERLNRIWFACRENEATMKDFEEALAEWEELHLQGIELMKVRKQENGN